MNLAWGSDGVTGNALGGVYASIFRALAMLPRIGLTISLNGKKGRTMAIRRREWF